MFGRDAYDCFIKRTLLSNNQALFFCPCNRRIHQFSLKHPLMRLVADEDYRMVLRSLCLVYAHRIRQIQVMSFLFVIGDFFTAVHLDFHHWRFYRCIVFIYFIIYVCDDARVTIFRPLGVFGLNDLITDPVDVLIASKLRLSVPVRIQGFLNVLVQVLDIQNRVILCLFPNRA